MGLAFVYRQYHSPPINLGPKKKNFSLIWSPTRSKASATDPKPFGAVSFFPDPAYQKPAINQSKNNILQKLFFYREYIKNHN